MTNERIEIISDLNYLWGITITMAKALNYSEDEVEALWKMFRRVDDALKNEDTDSD